MRMYLKMNELSRVGTHSDSGLYRGVFGSFAPSRVSLYNLCTLGLGRCLSSIHGDFTTQAHSETVLKPLQLAWKVEHFTPAWGSKQAHIAATAILQHRRWYYRLMSSAWILPDVALGDQAKKVHFWLISPENLFPSFSQYMPAICLSLRVSSLSTIKSWLVEYFWDGWHYSWFSEALVTNGFYVPSLTKALLVQFLYQAGDPALREEPSFYSTSSILHRRSSLCFCEHSNFKSGFIPAPKSVSWHSSSEFTAWFVALTCTVNCGAFLNLGLQSSFKDELKNFCGEKKNNIFTFCISDYCVWKTNIKNKINA